MTAKKLFEWWCIAFLTTLGAIAISIHWLDIPIAKYFLTAPSNLQRLGQDLGGSRLVTGQASLVLLLAIIRIVRGSLPEYAKALFVACCTSLCAFAVNDDAIKFAFGRYGPRFFLDNPSVHFFNFFHGDQNSVFPSGHMVMATAFGITLARIYPRTWPLFAGLLCIGAVALLVGDWHFLSDVIAGVFVGGTAGFISGEIWCLHFRNPQR